MSRLIDENDIIKMLNTMDRYTSEELTLCDTDKTFPMNEVFIVDDVFEGLDEIPSAQPDLIAKIQNGINATNANDSYSCGMRNGMRWCMSLVDDKEPLFENCPPAQPEVLACGEGELSAQPEREKGKWIYGESEAGNDGYYCSKCGNFVPWKYDEYDIDFIKEFLFCNKCGADMREDGATNADVES